MVDEPLAYADAGLGGGAADGGGFLFYPMLRRGGRTHVMQRRYALQGGGNSMMNDTKTAYKVVLAMMRRALRECCGYSKSMADTFGTHSCRRGGDTTLSAEDDAS